MQTKSTESKSGPESGVGAGTWAESLMTAKTLTRKQLESAYMRQLTYMHAAKIIDKITKSFMPEKIKNYPVLNKLIGEKCN
jgi:hypothetical protein